MLIQRQRQQRQRQQQRKERQYERKEHQNSCVFKLSIRLVFLSMIILTMTTTTMVVECHGFFLSKNKNKNNATINKRNNNKHNNINNNNNNIHSFTFTTKRTLSSSSSSSSTLLSFSPMSSFQSFLLSSSFNYKDQQKQRKQQLLRPVLLASSKLLLSSSSSSSFALHSINISRGGADAGADANGEEGDGTEQNINKESQQDSSILPSSKVIIDDINDNNDNDASAAAAFQGRILLCLVALLYGTLNVSLRSIYQLPEPPTASIMSATRGWLATVCFIPLIAFQKKNNENDNNETTTTTTTSSSSSSSSSFFLAGFELAVWNFLAQGLLNIGLLSTGSARASFLTQTSVVLTPIISFIAGQAVSRQVWIACGIALTGLTILSNGGGAAGSGVGGILSIWSSFSQGDCLVLGGALSWSMYLFRLSKIGSKFSEIPLQGMKTFLLAILYSFWVIYSLISSGVIVFGGGASMNMATSSLSSLTAWMTNVTAWAVLLYSAFGPGTLADVLQQQGQKSVSASEANVLLSMEPVFAALCATLLLGEVISKMEFIGGGLILLAALVATMTIPSSLLSSSSTATATTTLTMTTTAGNDDDKK